jgi:uncharacterized protein YbaP (TraB family)
MHRYGFLYDWVLTYRIYTVTSHPSYFFGTIHVPNTRVWGAVAANAKKAFQQSDKAKSRRSDSS